MKLTKRDIEYYLRAGRTDIEIEDLEIVTGKTMYWINFKDRLSTKKVIELLGRELYLHCITMSMYYRTYIVDVPNSSDTILFNSENAYKWISKCH